MISIKDNDASIDDAVSDVTLSTSVASMTTLLPDNISSDPPAGTGAFVTNSTLPLVKSLPAPSS